MTHFLLEQLKKSQSAKKPHAKTKHGFTAWKDMLRKCVERYFRLANRKVEQLNRVSSPCMDGHQFNQEVLQSVGEFTNLLTNCFKNACKWHELGDHQTSYGLSTSLQEQSENGLRHATDDWQD